MSMLWEKVGKQLGLGNEKGPAPRGQQWTKGRAAGTKTPRLGFGAGHHRLGEAALGASLGAGTDTLGCVTQRGESTTPPRMPPAPLGSQE